MARHNIVLPRNIAGAVLLVTAASLTLRAASLTVALVAAVVGADGRVQVPVDVSQAESLGSFQADVVYDVSALTAVSADAGPLAQNASFESNVSRPGVVKVAMATDYGSEIKGAGRLFTVTFTLKTPSATGKVSLQNIKAWDGTMQALPLQVTAQPDSISAGGAPSTTSSGSAPVLPSMTTSTPTLIAVILIVASLGVVVAAIMVVRQRRAAAGTTPQPKVEAGLSIVRSGEGPGTFRITSTRTTIGRGRDNAVVIDDVRVSTVHAEIIASKEGFLLRDLGSANGTTVNGEAVTERRLSVGDEIGIGTARVILTE